MTKIRSQVSAIVQWGGYWLQQKSPKDTFRLFRGDLLNPPSASALNEKHVQYSYYLAVALVKSVPMKLYPNTFYNCMIVIDHHVLELYVLINTTLACNTVTDSRKRIKDSPQEHYSLFIKLVVRPFTLHPPSLVLTCAVDRWASDGNVKKRHLFDTSRTSLAISKQELQRLQVSVTCFSEFLNEFWCFVLKKKGTI